MALTTNQRTAIYGLLLYLHNTHPDSTPHPGPPPKTDADPAFVLALKNWQKKVGTAMTGQWSMEDERKTRLFWKYVTNDTYVWNQEFGMVPKASQPDLVYDDQGYIAGQNTDRPGGVDPETGTVTPIEVEGRTPEMEDAYSELQKVLGQFGLTNLDSWLWEQIENNASNTKILQELRGTGEYQQRFAGLLEYNERGVGPAMTEMDLMEYEQSIKDIAARASLPDDMFDKPQDFFALLQGDVSVAEFADRATEVWQKVTTAPPAIREYFSQTYGVRGDEMLAAYIADPDKNNATLVRQAEAAVVGGVGKMFGYDVDEKTATMLGEMGVDLGRAAEGFASLNRLSAVFDESVGEMGGTDLEALDQGVEAVFNTGQGAEEIRQRVERRNAEFGGTGGVAATDQGLLAGEAY